MTQRQKCVCVCWECKDRQSWGWVHCVHKCLIHHTVTKQGREAGECVCVCGWCLMRTDKQSWPTAPENRFFWKNPCGSVCGYRSSSHRSACSLNLFSRGTWAMARKGNRCVWANFIHQGKMQYLQNFDYEQQWQKHKYAHAFVSNA